MKASERAGRIKAVAKDLLPPVVTRGLRRAKQAAKSAVERRREAEKATAPDGTPHLDVYWNPEKTLESWGEGNTWNEIKLLLVNCRGKVLDVACGTGRVMEILGGLPSLELHGTDISDLFIGKAREKGIPVDRLTVANAVELPYAAGAFDYSYSIGSLEHFSEPDIDRFLAENNRVTAKAAFHMVPCARSGRNEGWVRHEQHYHLNSVAWWLPKYERHFPHVLVCDSRWVSDSAVGKWFVCLKNWP